MGSRYKTFDSTGTAPNGRLYAGDMNAIQDMKAESDDYTQSINVGSLRVGDSGIALSKYGTSEARISAALRVDGVLRAGSGGGSGGGILPAVMSTTERDALLAGFRPKGMAIFNTTTNQWEYNAGTDAAPSWQAFVVGAAPSGSAGGDLTGSFPSPQIAAGVIVNGDVNAAAGIVYSKLLLTGALVNADIAAGAAILPSKLAGYPTDATKFLAGDGTWKVAASGAPSGPASGDLGGTYPGPTINALAVGTSKIADGAISNVKLLDGSVTSAKIQDLTIVDGDIAAAAAIAPSKIAGTAVVNADARLADARLPIQAMVQAADITVNAGATSPNNGATTFPQTGFYAVWVTWMSRHTVNNGKYEFRLNWSGGGILDWVDLEAGYTHTEAVMRLISATAGQQIWTQFVNLDGSGPLSIYNHEIVVVRLS